MAKKKKDENKLTYLQMPLPDSVKYSKMTKVAFGGLNKRYSLDSGELSMENNISSSEYPYLVPSERRIAQFDTDEKPYYDYDDGKKIPIGMYAFEDFIIVVYYHKYTDSNNAIVETIKVDYITEDEDVYTGILKKASTDNPITDEDLEHVSVVQFNVYDTPTDPLTGKYVKKLLFFPYKVSMYMHIEELNADISGLEGENLKQYSTDVMYCYEYNKKKTYCAVDFAVDEVDDAGNKTYKRVIKNFTDENEEYFLCDNMDVIVHEYQNTTPEADKSGAIIYPPKAGVDYPKDELQHYGYYCNTAQQNDIYAWRQYETMEREDEWGVKDGEVYGFKKDSNGNFIPDDGLAEGWKVCIPPAIPDLKYATVHLSRVFGVDDDRVYASGFNDYTNWNLDSIGEYNESNSWCSPAQSNNKAGGKFTGITAFQGHVVCFKGDFMHEIYNTKNPFRLVDIYAEGSIDNRSIQDVDGKLIFVSEDDVKIYTGSNPRIIGYNLNMPRYEYAVSGTDNRNYYLYCEESVASDRRHLYVYDTYTEMWSEQSIDRRVLSFGHNKNGMYMFCNDGVVYQMDSNRYDHEWSFETDLITSKTVNIKHIKKLQMLVEVEDRADTGFQVYILYDDEVFNKDSSHLVYSSEKTGKYPIRVKPRNTANYGFRLHFEGKGYVKLYELEIFIEAGGDLYV